MIDQNMFLAHPEHFQKIKNTNINLINCIMQYIDQNKFASFLDTIQKSENTGYIPGACYKNMIKAQKELYPKSI